MTTAYGGARLSAASLGLLAVLALLPVGCSREKYFRQADEEAQQLVAEKSNDPRWCMPPCFNIEMDPRSRYYDIYDEVRPPMPEDDPASHQYMHCVDSKKGWAKWHKNGDRAVLDNPEWQSRLCEYVPVSERGQVVLSLDSALDLARVNSPSYHQQIETIYLSALDVSTERFRFDVQFFGTNDLTAATTGRLQRGGAPRATGSVTTLDNELSLQAKRRFATAGELLVGFANSMVWQFAGPDDYLTFSILNFNFVQPLLRGAGRDIALEQLTISERALLANLRAWQRYRHGFYTNVAIGESGTSGPQRRGGFFGGTGLTGFSGQGSTGLGGVGDVTGFGRTSTAGGGGGSASFGAAGGGAGTVGGFLGLLQRLQQIRNTEETLALQLRTLSLLEAHLEAGTIDLTQVDQFRQSIETQRATLLQDRDSLEDMLDTYKTGTLGLPPDLPLDLDDTTVRQFQFIDPAISNLQNRLHDLLVEFGQQPAQPTVEIVQQAIDQLAQLQGEMAEQFATVAADVNGAGQTAPARFRDMKAAEQKSLESDLTKLAEGYEELRQRLMNAWPRLQKLREQLTDATRQATADRFVQEVTELVGIVDELSLIQARARLEKVTLQHESLDAAEALSIARANRLDWMNNRAAVVDTWRLIQFNADALQSGLDVTFSGDISSTDNQALRFRSPTGTLRAGLRFDAPFTRLLERNSFRQQIISYEQDRRDLIQFEDSVSQTLRSLVRRLEEHRINLEIQRRAVVIAIRRVDQTRDELNKPPPAPQPGQPTTALGPTAANNLVSALSALGASQNNFMSVWLAYYATRMRLAREIGTMELDSRGAWIDTPLTDAERLGQEEVPIPPAVPGDLLKTLDENLPKEQPAPDTSPPAVAPPKVPDAEPANPLRQEPEAPMPKPEPKQQAMQSAQSTEFPVTMTGDTESDFGR